MSKTFRREDRYMVIKHKDAQYLSETDNAHLSRIGKQLEKIRTERQKKPFAALVIEADWPEYEPTWDAIEKRINTFT